MVERLTVKVAASDKPAANRKTVAVTDAKKTAFNFATSHIWKHH
jgi:hypothetical protein